VIQPNFISSMVSKNTVITTLEIINCSMSKDCVHLFEELNKNQTITHLSLIGDFFKEFND
jgi:hypothetical protein